MTDPKKRDLVVGAGTGNDVQAALRKGMQEVISVDIDGVILSLGEKLTLNFASVLVLVWWANMALMKLSLHNPRRWLVPCRWQWSWSGCLTPNALLGGLVLTATIGFAGIIVSILLSRSRNASAWLGSNLLGSVLGHAAGLQWLALLALLLCACAAGLTARQTDKGL